MARARAPWWMYLVAASFFAFFCFTIYADLTAVGWEGADFDDTHGSLQITRLAKDSALMTAGLRRGDRVVSLNGRAIRTIDDWDRAHQRMAVGRAVDLEVERDGSTFHASLIPPLWPLSLGLNTPSLDYIGWRGAMLTWFLIALVVFLRPFDLSARLGSVVVATFPVIVTTLGAYEQAYGGWVATWQSLPLPIALLLLIPAVSSVLGPLTHLLFFSIFPRDEGVSLKRRALWYAPALLPVPFVFHTFWPVYDPPDFIWKWQGQARLAWIGVSAVYVFGAYGLLAANYRNLQDQNERRRVRAILPAFVFLLIFGAFAPLMRLLDQFPGTAPLRLSVQAALSVMVILFPLPIAYAIVRHRFFDISFVVRRGIQYLLARGFLLSILPALASVLLVDVALHQDQTVGAIFAGRGWLYAIAGVVALLARQNRQQWLDALDRRFFRERYNAEHLLRETAEEIRSSSSLDQVAPGAIARVESSLHPEFVALLVRDPDAPSYRTLASAPSGVAPVKMAAESKVIGLLRVLGKPLQVLTSESSWLQAQLPHADTEFLRHAHIDLLVPVSLSGEGREALLVLGPKKSEEPYAAADQELLVAIANGLALLLERPASPVSSSGLQECPQCGSCYDSGVGRCAHDGAALTASVIPRVLARRYRLDRRLGRGGMGTVYRALDTSLEREVALKLIRDDLMGSPEAAERFKREAKAAAALTHPNLVTLYDFNVDSSHRAFLVMELLSGVTLRQHIRNRRRLEPADVLPIIRGLCAAMAVAHQRGLIHRDLKPENIFLVTDGHQPAPKILDFGLAKFTDAAVVSQQATTLETGAGVLLGTPRYMSPEQLTGKPVSPGWDLWALAVIAYELLSGAGPFDHATSTAALQAAILAGSCTPIQAHVADAPERWQDFFTKSFSTDPSRRPDSSGEFLARSERAFS